MRKILEERPVGDNDVEIDWKQIKEGIQEVAGKVIEIEKDIGGKSGLMRSVRKSWINEMKEDRKC
ncbi:hypothetical protein C0J52_22143 [Blattella germanica]|nr:hypothetical protein C0J52_22143 [Blattella germanica]